MVDSLLVIKYVKVKVICNEKGIVVDFEVDGDFFKYGNDDDCVDELVLWILEYFMG